MHKLEFGDPATQTPNLMADNLAQLMALFPELITENADSVAINVDVLKELVGDKTVTDAEEKYGLTWHGKRRARQLALTPSTGTLRPCPAESVEWATTQNLMIEGDNLEVLKLLQKSYAGKVKMIYIDPPYNTGGDFVYPDDFQRSIENYQKLVGWRSENGELLSSNASQNKNSRASGRFHTNWLNLMYPRLKLARNLLRQDGVIFISIDDGELPGLRLVANEVFGEENFLACFVWKSRQNKDNRNVTGASVDHEYVLCYGNSIRGDSRDTSQYSNPDGDPRGDWTSANMVGIATADRRPNLHYDLIDPATGIHYGCPDMGWRYDRNTMARLIAENRILWPANPEGRPRRKAFLTELESEFTGFSTVVGEGIFTRDGTADIDRLFNARVFDFPKPARFVAGLVAQGSSAEDIVLDFFAGSGTSAHAVMVQNAEDGANRRYILVQLPEPLDPNDRDQKTAADFCDTLGKQRNIAELTKERLRRAGARVKEDNPMFSGDIGFRVFKLDSSNIRAWEPDSNNLGRSLEEYTEHLKTKRTEDDILYELFLKLGLDLCVPIETSSIAGKTVYSIGGGVLLVCLATSIQRSEVDTLALGIVNWHAELAPAGDTTCVFRDSAFADDVAKTNLTAILHQYGLENVRSL